MKTFTFYWLDGQKDVGKGHSVADAFSRLGYGGGALAALDFYSEGSDDDEYYFNKEEGAWRSKGVICT